MNPSVTLPTITAIGSTCGMPGIGLRRWRVCVWVFPLLNVGFFWYPGKGVVDTQRRECGMGASGAAGDVLQPPELGRPASVVVNNVNIARININVRNYAYADRAIVVPQNNFYRVNNYRDVRVTNINVTTIINNYRAAPVVNNTVINNYSTNNQRYNYTNAKVNEKPHNTVINRIQQNETIIRGGRKENAVVLEQQMKRLPEGRINREARIEQPRITDRIVPAGDVNKPRSEVKFEQKQIRGPGKGGPQVPPERVGGPRAEPGQPVAKPERVAPPQAGAPQQPGARTRTDEARATSRAGTPAVTAFGETALRRRSRWLNLLRLHKLHRSSLSHDPNAWHHRKQEHLSSPQRDQNSVRLSPEDPTVPRRTRDTTAASPRSPCKT